MNFKNSIQNELGQHEPIDVHELILDNFLTDVGTFSNEHKKTLELYSRVIHLSLNSIGLHSLKNFPALPELQILQIRENQITGSDFATLKNLYPKLYKLKVGENPISSLKVLEGLKNMTSLTKVEVIGCPITNIENYREKLFNVLGNVDIIDNIDRNGDDCETTVYEEQEEEDSEDSEEADECEEGEYEEEEEDGDQEIEEDTKTNKKQRKD